MAMSHRNFRRRARRQGVESPGALARAAGATRRGDTVQSRKAEISAGLVDVDDAHGVCAECWRVVYLRRDGTVQNHHHCPGGASVPVNLKELIQP